MFTSLYSIALLCVAMQSDQTAEQQAIDEIFQELGDCDNVLLQQAAKLYTNKQSTLEWQSAPRIYSFYGKKIKKSKLTAARDKKGKLSKKWQKISGIVFPNGVPLQATECSYDYAQQVVVNAKEKNVAAQLQNFQAGKFGNSDYLKATCEVKLNTNAEMAKSADYFDHTYCGEDGTWYAGIRLYDIWGAETPLFIADGVAISFINDVEGKKKQSSSFVDIYQRISQNFYLYRSYRVVRDVLSRLHLNPDASIDPAFESLRNNLNYAWMLMQHDPKLMAEWLDEAGNRDVFFSQLAARLKPIYSDPNCKEAPAHFAKNFSDRAEAPKLLKSITEKVLKRHELLGFSD